MTSKRVPLIAICTLSLGLLLAHYMFKEDPESKALRAFQKGQFDSAANSIINSKKLTASEKCLFEAYLCRASKDFEKSDLSLTQGLTQFRSETKKKRASEEYELIANQLYNFYLQGQGQKIDEILKEISDRQLSNNWFLLFEAIRAQQQQEHQRALDLIDKATPLPMMSEWMRIDFSKDFSKRWQELFQARSALAVGETVRARQLLQSSSEADRKSPKGGEENVLLALSYLQEGRAENDELAPAYYKLASAYLDLDVLPESVGASDQVFDVCLDCFKKNRIEASRALIESLYQWQAKDQLNRLADALIAPWLQEGKWPQDQQRREIADLPKDFRASLDQKVNGQLSAYLEKSETANTSSFYQNAVSVITDKERFNTEFEKDLKIDLLKRIKKYYSQKDRFDLALIDERLQTYAAAVGQNAQNSPLCSALVIDICDLTPLHLDQAAASAYHFISPFTKKSVDQLGLIASSLQNHLRQKFKNSWQARDFEAMSLQSELADRLNLPSITELTTKQVSAVLGDAEFLAQKGQLDQALTRLQWVLKLAPGQRQATSQMVDVLFAQKEFAKALTLINSTVEKRPELIEKSIACSLKLGSIDQALSASKSIDDHLSDDVLENLGKSAYAAGYFKRAKDCLFQIAKPSQTIWRLRTLAAFRAQCWELCHESFCHVSDERPPSPKLAAVALTALIEMRSDKEGEQLAQKIYHWLQFETAMKAEPDWEEAFIDDVEPAGVASRFYRERQQRFDEALNCLDLSNNQTASLFFERVRTLLAKQQPKLAQEWLNSWKGPLSDSEQLQKKALLSRICYHRGDQKSSMQIAHDLKELSYLPLSARIELVLALKDLQQWQSALDLLAQFSQGFGWELPVQLHRIDCLKGLGRYQEGAELLGTLQKDLPAHWKDFEKDQLAIKGLGLLIGSGQTPILLSPSNRSSLTPQRSAQLAQYFLDTGDLESARQMRGVSDLGLSDIGTCVLAQLTYIDQERDASLLQLKRNLRNFNCSDEVFSRNLRLFSQIAENKRDFAELIEQLNKQRSEFPSDRGLQRVAKALFDKANSKRGHAIDEKSENELQSQVKSLINELESLTKNSSQLIWPFVELGKLRQLMRDENNAQAAFSAALDLNSANAEANFGKCQDNHLDLSARLTFARKACFAAPQRADYWVKLGVLHIAQWQKEKSSLDEVAAKEAMTKANALDPLLLDTYWNMANLLLLQGEKSAAQKLAKAGLKKAPQDQRQAIINDLSQDIQKLLHQPLSESSKAEH